MLSHASHIPKQNRIGSTAIYCIVNKNNYTKLKNAFLVKIRNYERLFFWAINNTVG